MSVAEGSTSDPAARLLRVVVVADSRTRTRGLARLLDGAGFHVSAEVCTARDAEAAVVAHEPAVVLVDLAVDAGGIESIERIMGTRPTPVVVCGELAGQSEAALAAGAVDVVGALDALPSSPQYAESLRRHLRVASRVRVITHPRNRLRVKGLDRPVPTRPRPVTRLGDRPAAGAPAPRATFGRPTPSGPQPRVVVIGASTGGPPALATILAELSPRLPVPVLVVQHMADGFVEGLATWLDGLAPMRVVMAQHGAALRPGVVHVAPARVNTLLRPGLRIEQRTPPEGQFHVPGIDAAFASAAAVCRGQAVGVLLTGMGRDGAEGLRTMRESGAFTIGQDEPTSVVWGMPAAAQALGAVEVELPLPRIAAAITAAVTATAVAR